MKLGDIIINEYGHVGAILYMVGNEIEMSVFNYNIEDDTDWCSVSGSRLATEDEILDAFNKPI